MVSPRSTRLALRIGIVSLPVLWCGCGSGPDEANNPPASPSAFPIAAPSMTAQTSPSASTAPGPTSGTTADALFAAAQDAIQRNCAGMSCHNSGLGGFTPDSPREVLESRAEFIAAAVFYDRMPPGELALSDADRNAIVDWYFALPGAVERPE